MLRMSTGKGTEQEEVADWDDTWGHFGPCKGQAGGLGFHGDFVVSF